MRAPELFELTVRSGLKVLETMLEEDQTAICGPRYAHDPDRQASRAGTVSSEVVLGGGKVGVRRLRVRAEGREVPLATFQAMADVDPLNRSPAFSIVRFLQDDDGVVNADRHRSRS